MVTIDEGEIHRSGQGGYARPIGKKVPAGHARDHVYTATRAIDDALVSLSLHAAKG